MKIYGDSVSGNCLKVRYIADHLGVPYTWIPVDILRGESRTESFLAMNPMGQVPVIELDDGRALSQSNAILLYLARGSRLLPEDAFVRAQIDQWLFWEQYSHEPYIAVCRFGMVYRGQPKEERESWRVERGESALDLMESHLRNKDWFVGDSLTVADIALFAYTRVAHEGGFDLALRPNLRAWIARCDLALGLKV